MPKNGHDDSWFYEASRRLGASLWWAAVIIVSGTVVAYLLFHFL
jgi:hypothetical protein